MTKERELNERGLEATSKEGDAVYADSQVWIMALIVGSALASIAFGWFLARSIAGPVKQLSAVADKIAVGDVDAEIKINTREEIGQLADSFRRIVDAQREVAAGAAKIAAGDVNVDLKARSDKDVLTKAFLEMKGALTGLLGEIDGVVRSARDGKLDRRGDVAGFQGAYRSLIEGFNNTLDAVIEPVTEAGEVLQNVADRDLSVRVKGDYKGDHAKIKTALNNALENLEDALAQAAQGADQVSSASNEISKGSQSLARGASEQAGSLEEISSSLEEMSSMTKQNAENSQQGKILASSAREAADRGNVAMKRMGEAMDKIKSSSDATAKIVKTINEIAFQTNLLALNAAVEAARAGEAGKGFAVVAEEVRNLAQRSAEAARTTANMIEESVKNAESGVKISDEVAAILGEIGEGSRKVNDLVAEIAAASDEQSKGIEQVNSAVTQLDKVTQQNAASSEESASAAEELSSQAVSLSQVVSQFKLSGATAVAKPPVRAAAKTEKKVERKATESKKSRELELVGAGATNGRGKADRLIPLDDEDFKGF
ncbi:MAG: methyl-accepting chemotaxis protein [Pirellulales bacterium]